MWVTAASRRIAVSARVCGSTITQTADMMEGVTMIGLGTLEDGAAVKPAMQIYCDSALEWAKVPEVQGFAKMPG